MCEVSQNKTKTNLFLIFKEIIFAVFQFFLVLIVIKSCGIPTLIYFQSFQLEALNSVYFFQLSSSSFIIPTVYLKLPLRFLLCLRNNIETFKIFNIEVTFPYLVLM